MKVLLKENCVNITKAAIISGLKSLLSVLIGALIASLAAFITSGKNPFTKETWWLWVVPALVGAWKTWTKSNELKSLVK